MGTFKSPISYRWLYTTSGVIFGSFFPIFASWLYVLLHEMPVTLEGIFRAQATEPILWIVNSAPIFLGALAYLAGKDRDQLTNLQDQLELQVQTRTAQIQAMNDEMVHEIEERRRVEQIIQKGKREWEAIFDSVSDQILVVDHTGVLFRCNQAFIKALGKNYRDVIGRSVEEIFELSDGVRWATFACGSEAINLPNQDGWFDVTCFPIELEPERWGRIYTIRDVTEKIIAKNEIHRQKQFFKSLFENSPVAIVTLDNGHRIMRCNPAFESLFHCNREEVFGLDLDLWSRPMNFGPGLQL